MPIGRTPSSELGKGFPLAASVLAATWLLAAGCGGDGSGDAGPGEAGDGRAATPPDGPVEGVEELEPPTGPGSGQPRLSVGPEGSVLLSWLRPADGGAHELVFSELADGGWSEPRIAARGEDFFVNWADLPSVARTGGDTLVAHWLRKTGPGPYAYGIRVAFSADGGRSWGDPIVPHRDGTQTEHGFVSLLPAGDGGVRAVWLDGRRMAASEAAGAGAGGDSADGPAARSPGSGGEAGDGPGEGGAAMTLRSAVVLPGGGIRSSALVDGRVCDCCQTSAARTRRGPLVVYRDRSAGEVRDVSAVRLEEDGWTPPAAVHRDGWRIHACPVNGPAVDTRGDTAAVAWFTGADDRPRVRAAFSTDAGDSFGPPVDLDGGRPAGRVDVALVDGRRALVSWVESTAEGAEIRLRAAGPDGSEGPATRLAPASAERAGGFPRMALVGDTVVVAWTDPGGDGRVRAVRARLSGR